MISIANRDQVHGCRQKKILLNLKIQMFPQKLGHINIILVRERQQIVVAGYTVSVNGSSVGCLNSTVGLVLTYLTTFHKEEFPL